MKKNINKQMVKKVQKLRATLDPKTEKPLTLKQIKKETKLSIRTIKFILYERGNQRVKDLVAERMRERREDGYIPSEKTKRKPFTYPLIQSEYILLYSRQKGKCAICNISIEKDNRSTHVDHDHKTGKVRGILCAPCNYGLGCFRDNSSFLKKAIDYLSYGQLSQVQIEPFQSP